MNAVQVGQIINLSNKVSFTQGITPVDNSRAHKHRAFGLVAASIILPQSGYGLPSFFFHFAFFFEGWDTVHVHVGRIDVTVLCETECPRWASP